MSRLSLSILNRRILRLENLAGFSPDKELFESCETKSLPDSIAPSLMSSLKKRTLDFLDLLRREKGEEFPYLRWDDTYRTQESGKGFLFYIDFRHSEGLFQIRWETTPSGGQRLWVKGRDGQYYLFSYGRRRQFYDLMRKNVLDSRRWATFSQL